MQNLVVFGLRFDPVVLAVGQALIGVVFGIRRWLHGSARSSRSPANRGPVESHRVLARLVGLGRHVPRWYVRIPLLFAATYGVDAATAAVRDGAPWPNVLLRGAVATVLHLVFLLSGLADAGALRHGRTYVGASGIAGFDEWTAASIERSRHTRVPDSELQALMDAVRTGEQPRDGALDVEELDPTVVVSERDLDS
ncbi:MAG: hypothetical protein IT299_06535 [Dehalococcoidia bacterium]|nr:hypothetical protein [Dehalococcoidia bacterium]